MKKFFLLFLITLFTVNVFADNAANKNVTALAHARVIQPLSLVNTGAQPLNFGVIANGTASSAIIVAATANPTPTVNGTAVVLSSSTQTAAKFTVTGEKEKDYTITIPVSSTITDGVNTLTVNNYTCSLPLTTQLPSSGTDVFYIGATLLLPETATPGQYTGSFNITVAYN